MNLKNLPVANLDNILYYINDIKTMKSLLSCSKFLREMNPKSIVKIIGEDRSISLLLNLVRSRSRGPSGRSASVLIKCNVQTLHLT